MYVYPYMLYQCIHICIHICIYIHILHACLCMYAYRYCNVTGLLCNNKDAVYYYTALLTAYLQLCFCLNVFWTGLCYIWLQCINMTGMPMGMADYIIYNLIGQCYCTYMYILVIIYCWGITKLLMLHPLCFTKDTLSAKAFTISTVNMYSVFNVFAFMLIFLTMAGSMVLGGIQLR